MNRSPGAGEGGGTQREINPETYLADVLLRVQSHPNSRLDELLPHEWKRLHAADSS